MQSPSDGEAIDTFSLHRWISDVVERRQLPVRRLGSAEESLPREGNAGFTAGVRVMLHWCRINEELVTARHGSGARVLAGFERLSRVRPVVRRYRRLAAATDRLVIFGQQDERPSLDAEFVDVGEGPMAREWFLLIDAPRYRTLLVARDELGFGDNGPLRGRRFTGVTLHDSQVVQAAAEELLRRAPSSEGGFRATPAVRG